MLAPYTNVAAFMKEWRFRAPPGHRGFGNQSSVAITANNQSAALVAINRAPQDYPIDLGPSTTGSVGGLDGDSAKIVGIIFGVFGGMVLISVITGIWLLIRYRRKMQDVAEETPNLTVEQVETLDISPEFSYGPLPSSSSPDAPVQQPGHRVRSANSPSAIDGSTSTPSSPQRCGAVVENWVEGCNPTP